MSILRTAPEKTRELNQQDPAVRAGIFSVKVMPWMVPSDAIAFPILGSPDQRWTSRAARSRDGIRDVGVIGKQNYRLPNAVVVRYDI